MIFLSYKSDKKYPHPDKIEDDFLIDDIKCM